MTTASKVRARTRPLRALFVNQGPIAKAVLGHVAVEAALKAGMDGLDEIDARFVRMPSWNLPARLIGGRVPGLQRLDLDLHVTRWHVAESMRGRHTILRALQAFDADVIHVDSHTPALLVGDVMRRTPTVLSVDVPVWEWHEMGFSRALRRYSRATLGPSVRLERRAFRNAAEIVTRSAWAAEAVRRTCPQARVEVLHPGIDIERFCPGPQAQEGPVRVLFVGARFEEKGGEDLLNAIDPMLGDGARLDIVTSSEVRARPGVDLHRLSNGDARLVELYQRADIFCMPTHGDSFGWAILEAMACATPVIATPLGAIPELLGHEEAGLAVPPREPAALRAALARLIADAGLRREMGAAARSRVERDFDVRRQGIALRDVLRQAAGWTGEG